MNCSVCLGDEGKLGQYCQCSGTCGWYHEDCLVKMIQQMHLTKCNTCRGEFRVVGKLERALRWEWY
jgi:E3 ubiquitin-protein ligase DOA10